MKKNHSFKGVAALIALTLTGLSHSAMSQDGPILPKQPPQPIEPKYGDYPNTTIKFPLTDDQLPTPLPGQPKLVIPGPDAKLPTQVVQIKPAKEKELTLFWNQQAFDIFAWQAFIALNREADPKKYGKPSSKPLGKAPGSDRVWETFIPPELIFKEGLVPDPYQADKGSHPNVAHSLSKRTHLLSEIDEAFFNLEKPLPPILDIHSEYARYEIRINRPEYDYIVKGAELNGLRYPLYSLDGQKLFVNKGGQIVFPTGSIELKIGWKKLTKGEIDGKRFFTQTLEVYENPAADPPKTVKGTYGMVAMHIMYLVEGVPQWVWPTFEHVDNAPISDLRKLSSDPDIGEWAWREKKNGTYEWSWRKPKSTYSFFSTESFVDGNDPLKTSIGGYSPASHAAMIKANAIYNSGVGNYYQSEIIPKRIPSQITKVVTANNAIVASKWTAALNQAVQKNLPVPWSNYQLVSTQWPSESSLNSQWQKYTAESNIAIAKWNFMNPSDQKPYLPPVGGGTIRAGNPAPISLGNAGAETYMQINGSCMNCHAGSTLNFKYTSGPFEGAKPDADFSFMLQRAQ